MPFAVDLVPEATNEYLWLQHHRPNLAEKVDDLIAAIEVDPFRGIGKPEPLKHGLHGFWSRRVTKKHRMVYHVSGDMVYVHRCYEHYDD